MTQKHFGTPGHFCASNHCQYHRHTLVNDKYVVSTIARLQYEGREEYQKIRLDRWGETYVFNVKGISDCGCPDIDCEEIDSLSYSEEDIKVCSIMDNGHDQMIRKYENE